MEFRAEAFSDSAVGVAVTLDGTTVRVAADTAQEWGAQMIHAAVEARVMRGRVAAAMAGAMTGTATPMRELRDLPDE